MKQVSNKDLLNAIRNEASEEYKEHIGIIDGKNLDSQGVWKTFEGYPTYKNEFIQALATKVVKSEFFSKVYENPLKMLKRGTLTYGQTIEHMFVKAAEAKGFFKSGRTSGNKDLNDVTELIGIETPEVELAYISKNFAYVFKTSISDAQLKSAFRSENGLSELVNQIVGSLTSGAEQQEYQDMKNILFATTQGRVLSMKNGVVGSTNDIGTMESPDSGKSITVDNKDIAKGAKQYMYIKQVKAGNNEDDIYKNLAIQIRTLAGKLKFADDKYNMAKVKTWSNPEDLIFITTPEVMANMDVRILANAFNVSMTDVKQRTILVDSLPTKFITPGGNTSLTEGVKTGLYNNAGELSGKFATTNDCLGLLVDKDFLQVWDTLNESRVFDNGRNLTQNLFLHKQGIMANCYFANAIALIKF